MAFMGRNRFNASNGIRGGNPNPGPGMNIGQRAGFGSEQNPAQSPISGPQQVLSSAPAGNPHSSAGFRRALEKTARGSSRLKGQMPNGQTFSGPGYRKPSYFGQGGGRHGMHIGAGAPFTGPASGDAGSNFGG